MISSTKTPIKISNEFVRNYYYAEFDQHKKKNSGVVIDDACYELMFVKERNVKLVNGKDKPKLLPSCYTLNNLKGPFRFEFSDTFSSFCVKLQPWMNASFVPTKESQLLDINKIYAGSPNKLHRELFNAKSFDEMVDHTEDFLISLSILPNKNAVLIKNICKLVEERAGNISVNEIAESFDIYRQKLNMLFKQEVKYTLKTFINNIRIRACLNYKFKKPEISLTEISYEFGFYDQAHFIRAFKNACGVTPSEYVRSPGYSKCR